MFVFVLAGIAIAFVIVRAHMCMRYPKDKKMSTLVEFKKLDPQAIVPRRATPDSAGFDLHALESVYCPRGKNTVVRTGIAVKLPPGTYGRIAIRSGHAVRCNLSVSAGVIDRDYRGDIGVVVSVPYNQSYDIKAGDRFAQLVIEKCWYGDSAEVAEFSPDDMQSHLGYGSTGN